MIGENIKAIRKNKGMTQEELAIKLNVARQTISKWEKGLSVPDAEMVQKISEILGEEQIDMIKKPCEYKFAILEFIEEIKQKIKK